MPFLILLTVCDILTLGFLYASISSWREGEETLSVGFAFFFAFMVVLVLALLGKL